MNWKSATLQDYMVSCWNLLDTYIHGFISWWNLMEGRERDHLTWWMELMNRIPTDDSSRPGGELDRLHPMEWKSFRGSWAELSRREKETCFLDMVIFHRSTSSRSTITMLSWGAQTQVALGALLSYRFLNKTNPCLFKLQRVPSQMVIGSE